MDDSLIIVSSQENKDVKCFDARTLKMRYSQSTLSQNLRVRKVTDEVFMVSTYRRVSGASSSAVSPLVFYDAASGTETSRASGEFQGFHMSECWCCGTIMTDSFSSPRVLWTDKNSNPYNAILIDSSTHELLTRLPSPPATRSMAFVHEWDDELYLGGYNGYMVHRYNLEKGVLLGKLNYGAHYGGIWGLEADPERKMLMSISYDSSLQIWGRDSGQKVGSIRFNGGARSGIYAPDLLTFFGGIETGHIYVFDLRNPNRPLQCPDRGHGFETPFSRPPPARGRGSGGKCGIHVSKSDVYDIARVSKDCFVSVAHEVTLWRLDGKILNQDRSWTGRLRGVCVMGSEYDRPMVSVDAEGSAEDFRARVEFVLEMNEKMNDDACGHGGGGSILQKCVFASPSSSAVLWCPTWVLHSIETSTF